MEEKDKNTGSRIELRSEKVRHIISSIPVSLVVWGYAVIAIILIILMCVLLLVPYPYSGGETIFQHIFNI